MFDKCDCTTTYSIIGTIFFVCCSGLATAIIYDIVSEEIRCKRREAESQAQDHAYRMMQFMLKINLIDSQSTHTTNNYANRYNFRKRPIKHEKHDKT